MAQPKGSRRKTTRKAKAKGALRVKKDEIKETTTKTDDQADLLSGAMTPEQQAIVKRVQAAEAEWEPITEEQMSDFALMTNPLNLDVSFPEAWKEQQEKRFAFRWCEREDKRIDELTRSGHPVTRWKLCTRTTTPFLEQYVDSIYGCVTRLDQVLLFRPWDRHMIEKRAKDQTAEAKAEAGKPDVVAMRNAQEGVEAMTGPEHKIGSGDEVQYEDSRVDADMGDLVVES